MRGSGAVRARVRPGCRPGVPRTTRVRRVRGIKETSLRASAAAAVGGQASDFKHASASVLRPRRLAARVRGVVRVRRLARASAREGAEGGALLPAVHLRLGVPRVEGRGGAPCTKAEREAAAIRAYADIHRRLVAKHVRAPAAFGYEARRALPEAATRTPRPN